VLTKFKEKRFRYGTFSTAMMLVAVALFVMVNLVGEVFNHTWDMTGGYLITLSDPSHAFLAELDEEITLTMIAQTGTEDPRLAALLQEYAAASRYISTAQRDPLLSPAFLQAFDAGMGAGVIPDHSIIVQSAAQYRVITLDTMFSPRFNLAGQVIGIASVNFERQITTAIYAVTRGEVATVYKVLGSGESPLDPAFIGFLETENFIVRSVDALEIIQIGIPHDADMLLLSVPEWDWPAEKADRILAFLEAEGRAFVAAGPQFGARRPNFDRVLAAYGIRISDYFVMDADPRAHFMLPMFVLPQLWPHEITLPLAAEGRGNMFLSFAAAIEPAAMIRGSTTVEPLFFTSPEAFGRADAQLESFLFHENTDQPGPFMTAVTITDAVFTYRNLVTQLVVVGNDAIWAAGSRDVVGDNNFLFVASALRWLTGQEQGLFIPTRPAPGVYPTTINQFQSNMIAGVSLGILPLVMLGIGAIIWYRRRQS